MQAKMPKAARKTGKAAKKPSQLEVGDVANSAVMDTETREGPTDKRTVVLTDVRDTQEAGGSGLQGPTAGSGKDSTDTDSLVERARWRLARLK